MKIIQTTMAELDGRQIQNLRKMTLPDETSWMKRTIDLLTKPGPNPGIPRIGNLTKENVIVAIAKNDRRWLGWALIRPWYYDRNLVMVFVKPAFRCQGVGRKLISHLRKTEEFDCYPWDWTSEEFFKNVKLTPYWQARP